MEVQCQDAYEDDRRPLRKLIDKHCRHCSTRIEEIEPAFGGAFVRARG